MNERTEDEAGLRSGATHEPGASRPDAASVPAAGAPAVPGRDADGEQARLRAREAQLRAYARLLDSALRLPGGFRVGLDGLVGLVPVVGDLVGLGLSGYLVVAAARLGIPRSVVARMILNVVLETGIGVVPIIGDAFDFVFKANERNVRLLERELDRRAAAQGTHGAAGGGRRTG